jgi:very-short-patch-repair endonuclease
MGKMDKLKNKYKDVYDYFIKENCELLEKEYINNNTLMKYKCSCGNISTIRWRLFQSGKRCKECKVERMLKTTKKNNNGELHLKTKKFLDQRELDNIKKYGVKHVFQSKEVKSKIAKTNMERYGVEHVSNSPIIRQKQIDGLVQSYGVEYPMHSKEIKEKFHKTIMDRYGAPNLAFFSNSVSKESQKLFWEIYNKLEENVKVKTYFGELNAEFVKRYKDKYYKYDFVNTKFKKSIEYNGKNFHPHPSQNEDDTKWFAFDSSKTVREAREYELIKYEALEKQGFQILTVWDFEYRKDLESLVEKCLLFLLS